MAEESATPKNEDFCGGGFIPLAGSFCDYGKPSNPPEPPLRNLGNYKRLLLKSSFEKGGFRGI
jgi:hypothetical protein